MKCLKSLGFVLVALLFLAPMGWAFTLDVPAWVGNDDWSLKSRGDDFNYASSPEEWRDRNIYQLFTDRFATSGENKLTGKRANWTSDGKDFPYNRNYHHGGDWKGLQQQLGYLEDMGVTALWISGVQENDQGKDTRYTPYHQYHVDNFFKCDPAMGTFEDLRNLIDDCHARGIAVILDVAPNHMSDKTGILSSDDDDKRYWPDGHSSFGWYNESNKHPAPFDTLNYFHNNGTINNWDSSPENLWGQFKGTDDLRTEHGEVSDILTAAFKNLIDATDCDGFRVDAIKHMPYDWCRQWAQNVRDHAAYRGKHNFLMFGELFSYDHGALASWCADGWGFNSALLFPMVTALNNVFGFGYSSYQLGEEMDAISRYGQGAERTIAFLDNHDVDRFALKFGGSDAATAKRIMSPALTFLYLAPPVPLLYYGTEHMFNQGGHPNGSNRTDDNPDDGDWQRECMFDKGFQPGNAQGDMFSDWAKERGLYYHVAWLNGMRNKSRALRRGGFAQRYYSSGQGVYAFTKWFGDEVALVIVNTSDNEQDIPSINAGKGGSEYFENGDRDGASFWSSSDGWIDFGGTKIGGKGSKVYICNPEDNSGDLTGSSAPSLWARSTYAWPSERATTADTIFINVDAGPADAVTKVEVIYGFNNPDGAWPTKSMVINQEWDSQGGSWYNLELGNLSTGILSYCVLVTSVSEGVTNYFWDNNGGNNYTLEIFPAPATTDVDYREVSSWPTTPEIGGSVTITVSFESAPEVDVSNLKAWVGYAIDEDIDNVPWPTYPLGNRQTYTNETDSVTNIWTTFTYDIDDLPAGGLVKYYIEATLEDGQDKIYANNNGQDYTIQVPSWPIGVDDGIVITTPAETPSTVTNAGTYTVSGTAGSDLFGAIRWTNALTGDAGTAALSPRWSIPVALQLGGNAITVEADLTPTVTLATNAIDSAANYTGGFAGLDEGDGFGPWVEVTASDEGTDKSWSFVDENGFGLAVEYYFFTQASRELDVPLAAGDTFSIFFKNGDVAWPEGDIGPGVGFGLCNTGDIRDHIWGFWFNGSDDAYSITDGTTDINWSADGFQIDFTLTSETTYRVDITPAGGTKKTYAGSFTGTINAFRFWNWSSKGVEWEEGVKIRNFNVYVDNPVVTRRVETPNGVSSQTVTIVVVEDEGGPAMVLDDPDHPAFFDASGFTFMRPEGYDVDAIFYATNLLANGNWDWKEQTQKAVFTTNADETITIEYPDVTNAPSVIFGVTFK